MIALLTFIMSVSLNGSFTNSSVSGDSGFLGMWSLDIEGGGVGWLNVHQKNGYLDAELLWIGGSVLPVSHIYHIDEDHLVVTRTNTLNKTSSKDGDGRKHIMTFRLDISKVKDNIFGTMKGPNWNGDGETSSSFIGYRLPVINKPPNLANLKYGKTIKLFNGQNLDGWQLINSDHKNGFKVTDGVLINDPIQEDNNNVHYGNLRTVQEFGDFNLKLEVNVPAGNNSGIYLRGMYEIQVFDSFGKELDSHNMGAVYSRVTPSAAAERPGGEWQSFDITLCDRHITVILNGTKIINNQPVYGPTGGAIISDVLAHGPIFLQGDHGKVSYRSFELREIIK